MIAENHLEFINIQLTVRLYCQFFENLRFFYHMVSILLPFPGEHSVFAAQVSFCSAINERLIYFMRYARKFLLLGSTQAARCFGWRASLQYVANSRSQKEAPLSTELRFVRLLLLFRKLRSK